MGRLGCHLFWKDKLYILSISIVRRLIKLLPFYHCMKKFELLFMNIVHVKFELLFVNIGHVLRRDAFYCNALSGNSSYNICINSDMTVSCNCVDIDGSGHIGDLSSNTLEEIFDGITATKFRKSLSRGILPVKRCLKCWALMKTHRTEAKSYLSNYTTPKHGIMVENMVQCNLSCINCKRKKY